MSGFEAGQWNVICDRCGFQFKSRELRAEWTGLRVCGGCHDTRHPQDFVKGKADKQNVPWSRPEAPDLFVGEDIPSPDQDDY
jgi:hypothetical protein